MEQRTQSQGKSGQGKSGADARRAKQSVQHVRLKLFILLGLCALPGFGALSMAIRGVSAIPASGYAVMSLLAFFLYWHDKNRARNDGWRTPEKVLHGVELLAGSPAGTATLSAQNPQTLLSSRVLADRHAASGILDRPLVSARQLPGPPFLMTPSNQPVGFWPICSPLTDASVSADRATRCRSGGRAVPR